MSRSTLSCNLIPRNTFGPSTSQVSGVLSGKVCSLTVEPIDLLSMPRWFGFPVQSIASEQLRAADGWWSWPRTQVALIADGVASVRVRASGKIRKVRVPMGSSFLFPRSFGETQLCLSETSFRAVWVEVDDKLIERFSGLNSGRMRSLQPSLSFRDQQISAILRNMAFEIASGCPSGRDYHISLSLSLAYYLQARFSKQSLSASKDAQILSEHQRDVLEAYIRDNLDKDLRLERLTSVLRISARQFARLFMNTYKTTPHRYVIHKRIDQAKDLIAGGKRLVEIANKVGFSSQSHFTDVFKKATGVAPGQYRRKFCDLDSQANKF